MQVREGGRWVTLDFIGTGGALDSTLMGNHWLPYRYDISFLRPGSVTALRFLFESDSANEYEGVYLDDIVVEPGRLTVSAGPSWWPQVPAGFDLRPNFPNPFNLRTELACVVGHRARVEVAVYDLGGRLVRTLLSAELPPGVHKVQWDGQDHAGNALSSGIYFAVMRGPAGRIVRKMMLLR